MDSYFCGTPNSFQSQIISTFYRVVITSLIQFGQRALITELSGANMSYFTCIFPSSALILIHVGLRSFINVFFFKSILFIYLFFYLFLMFLTEQSVRGPPAYSSYFTVTPICAIGLPYSL